MGKQKLSEIPEISEISEISKECGKSRSTVSKVLRGCPGVTEETRRAVLRAADRVDRTRGGDSVREICAILPDNPKYFWKPAQDALAAYENRVSLKVYSSIGNGSDSAVVARYVRESVDAGARALILASRPDEALRAVLSEYADRVLILQMCEYVDVPNTFFVGSDGYCDGMRLGALVKPVGDRPVRIGVPEGDGSYLSNQRIAGFLAGLPLETEVYRVKDPESRELYSACLARAIHQVGAPLDSLFCCDGVTASACEALYKLRGAMKARLLGFEYPKAAEKYLHGGWIAALLVQDPAEQMRAAIALAERYTESGMFPDRKFHYLQSNTVTGD